MAHPDVQAILQSEHHVLHAIGLVDEIGRALHTVRGENEGVRVSASQAAHIEMRGRLLHQGLYRGHGHAVPGQQVAEGGPGLDLPFHQGESRHRDAIHIGGQQGAVHLLHHGIGHVLHMRPHIHPDPHVTHGQHGSCQGRPLHPTLHGGQESTTPRTDVRGAAVCYHGCTVENRCYSLAIGCTRPS
jgi:hypothetical protein